MPRGRGLNVTGQLAENLLNFFNSSLQILLREALKKTAKIVTSSLSGGRGVSLFFLKPSLTGHIRIYKLSQPSVNPDPK